jgi:hypothetical protein
MPQQTLHAARLTLVPLTNQHLELEVELDSDPEVMRYLSGRASSRDEVEANHARRMSVAQFPTSITAPVEGVEEGEVEYEMTREQWERRAT